MDSNYKYNSLDLIYANHWMLDYHRYPYVILAHHVQYPFTSLDSIVMTTKKPTMKKYGSYVKPLHNPRLEICQ